MERALFEAARLVRSYLSDLVPERAATLDGQIADLLDPQVPDPADTAERLAELFESEPALRDWVADVLADPDLRPPDVIVDGSRGGTKYLPVRDGEEDLTQIGRFACPFGERVWYQRTSTETIPICPEHSVQFVPSPRPTPSGQS